MTTRRRARSDDGRLMGDDPSTPDVNEAWVDDSAPEPAPEPPAITPPAPGALQPSDLAGFMGLTGGTLPNPQLAEALDLAHKGIEAFVGRRLPNVLERNQRQAVLFTASSVFLRGRFDRPPSGAEIPATARYYVMRG